MDRRDIDLSWVPEGLNDPFRIQLFLNSIPYDPELECRSPRIVMEERKAHCFEGALLAAACLRRLGFPPLLVDLRAVNDDDHVIAVFEKGGRWGAVAKSNFTTLRFREPVYRTVRELAMSYFDLYFNTKGEKTLRSYSSPFDLSRFDEKDWMITEEDLEFIGDALDRSRHYPLITGEMAGELNVVEDDLMQAGLLGSDPKGLYRPE
ncbi:MAG: hypothetical protein ACMUHM_05520 [Thermoplasmatota archaeon]